MRVTRKRRPNAPKSPAQGPFVFFADAGEPRWIVVGRDANGQPIYAPVQHREAFPFHKESK